MQPSWRERLLDDLVPGNMADMAAAHVMFVTDLESMYHSRLLCLFSYFRVQTYYLSIDPVQPPGLSRHRPCMMQ